MFRGLSGREILLRNAENGAGASGGTSGQGDPGNAGGSGNAGTGNGGTPAGDGGAPTFETWYGGLDAATKALLDGHTSGLKNALDAERNERKSLSSKLADLQKGAEKGSDLEKQLSELQANLKGHEAQSAFYDAAHANGVTNLKLAWLAANEAKLVTDKGVDWAAFKTQFPELFRVVALPTGATNPGNNGRSAGPLTLDMVKRMSQDEINARWAEVSAVLSKG